MEDQLEFFFRGNAVGTFDEICFPKADGDYKYTAYRGYGHLDLGIQIESIGHAVCYYETSGKKISFKVERSVKTGKLKISEFSESDSPK